MKASQGEQRIINILKKEKKKFEREYSFSSLKSYKGRKLRFDFALFEEDKIISLIEFQGRQHYIYNKHFTKSSTQFLYRQEMDLRKCQYALANNIPLYCIPYYDLDKLNKYEDLINPKYLVKNKWHNHNVAFDLRKSKKL